MATFERTCPLKLERQLDFSATEAFDCGVAACVMALDDASYGPVRPSTEAVRKRMAHWWVPSALDRRATRDYARCGGQSGRRDRLAGPTRQGGTPMGSARIKCRLTSACVVGLLGSLVLAGAGSALDCDITFPVGGGSIESLADGQVACGGPGPDSIETMDGGVFLGRGGEDRVVTQAGGKFVGGRGYDVVYYLEAGRFYGGGGTDQVLYYVHDGLVVGGPGNDRVERLDGGVFKGGPDDDRVGYVSGGTFYGAAGADFGPVRLRHGRLQGRPGRRLRHVAPSTAASSTAPRVPTGSPSTSRTRPSTAGPAATPRRSPIAAPRKCSRASRTSRTFPASSLTRPRRAGGATCSVGLESVHR